MLELRYREKSELTDAIDKYGIIPFVKGAQLFMYLIIPCDDERQPECSKGPIQYKERLIQ